MAAFVYAGFVTTDRLRRRLAVSLCAAVAAGKSSFAAAVTVARFTATLTAPDRRGTRSGAKPVGAGNVPVEGGVCTPPGWPNVGQNAQNGRQGPTSTPLEWRPRTAPQK